MEQKRKPKYFNYKGEKVRLSATTYAKNGKLAIEMYCEDGEPYGVITVNMRDDTLQSENTAFADTNNFPDIDKWLDLYGLAQDTGIQQISGYCAYPLMIFDLDKFYE